MDVRFKLEENLPASLGAVFKAHSLDVDTATAEGLAGAPDARVAAACQRDGRALVTFDLDFADLRVYPPADYPGFIVLRLSTQAADHVVRVMDQVLRLLPTEPVAGHLWLVEDTQVRIR